MLALLSHKTQVQSQFKERVLYECILTAEDYFYLPLQGQASFLGDKVILDSMEIQTGYLLYLRTINALILNTLQ